MAATEIPIIEFQSGVHFALTILCICVTLITGVRAILAARSASASYYHRLGALGCALGVCLLSYWVHRDFTLRDLSWYTSQETAIDPSLMALTEAYNYLNRANYLYIALVGTIMGCVSLSMKK
ncbi:hypothetical protein SAMN02745181_0373 [Rubritalea squalenifaciens DSM 18772]|uniref:Uncharacterized protein n=1 Tax=Rubritalea squalenifaciens DSM 18772 TaxID=1123071 RepID=A0A1M6C3J0_9BACT|nr:hypothetical protein [Rubritalea squalenifaciens]SHI55334.1 hypothetical protein SAMN02745181_0373 [Rubritalea squalenifaciens DSM 18772]